MPVAVENGVAPGRAGRLAGRARRTPIVRRQMAATIAVLSQKGGTGKTTTVRTLTDVLRRIDLRVLAIDLDPQGNLSDYLDVDPEASPTIADVLTGRASASEAIHDGIIPANLGLAEAELSLGGKMGRELALKKALREVKGGYDFVLIDCPPSLGLLTVNALVAADYALLSAEAQYFAMTGVEQALEVIELARETLNPDLEWLGVFLNIADMRTRHSREAFESLRQHYDDKLFDTPVRASIAYAESAERARSIIDYRPALGLDYIASPTSCSHGSSSSPRAGGWPRCPKLLAVGPAPSARATPTADRSGTRASRTAARPRAAAPGSPPARRPVPSRGSSRRPSARPGPPS